MAKILKKIGYNELVDLALIGHRGVAVYVQEDEPTDMQEGDIWIHRCARRGSQLGRLTLIPAA